MLSCSWTSGPTADFVGMQQSTHTTNSMAIKYNKRLHARFPLSPRPTSQLPNFHWPDYPAGNNLSKLRTANEVVKDNSKFVRSILSRTRRFAGAAQRESYENWFQSSQLSCCHYHLLGSHFDKENTKQRSSWKQQNQ